MPEKSPNWTWMFGRANPAVAMVQWWFKFLIIGVFLGILIVWGIDGFNMNLKMNADTSFLQEFAVQDRDIPASAPVILPQIENPNPPPSNFTTQIQNPIPPFSNFTTQIQNPNVTLSILPHQSLELAEPPEISPTVSPNSSSPSMILSWPSSEFGANYSSNLLANWLTPGGDPCKDSRTVDIRLSRFDIGGHDKVTELSTGEIHEFVFQALDDSGEVHCLGGDYFELDLSGQRWKSRPPVKDMGNGSYSFSLQVHPGFAGDYNLTIILLFRHYEGLKFVPPRFVVDKVLRVVRLKFVKSLSQLPEIWQCTDLDFVKDVWSGRWTRHARNDNCPISHDGRYRCQEPSFPCQRPWCDGPLGMLESNGWVYSAHCSFKLFRSNEVWSCLSGRWIFWWGDSNHCDTIRNMLHFILGVHDIATVPRIFDMNISNPKNPSQMFRFTSIFNGHWNHTQNYQGLNSLINPEYRQTLKGYFSQNVVPDTVVMNSGLHDGVYWTNIRNFIKGADYAAAFWAEVMEGITRRGATRPRIIYRTTVTTGGYARSLAFNPQKMEAFNGVVLDKLRQRGILDRVIDDFDMTYPWHYDNRCNDGVHYGRAPLKAKWRDGQIGHQYFVDLMLGHVLINALCAKPA